MGSRPWVGEGRSSLSGWRTSPDLRLDYATAVPPPPRRFAPDGEVLQEFGPDDPAAATPPAGPTSLLRTGALDR